MSKDTKKAPAAKKHKSELQRLEEIISKSVEHYSQSHANSQIAHYKLSGAVEALKVVLNSIREIQNG